MSTLQSLPSQQVIIRTEKILDSVRFLIEVYDPALLGRPAKFSLLRKVEVNDSRPVNASDEPLRREIASLSTRNEVMVAKEELQFYSYNGSKVRISLTAELKIDDSILFDTAITQDQEIALGMKPGVTENAKEMVEPSDAFNFITNFNAIPPKNKMITAVLMMAALVVIGVNSLIGLHDELSPDSAIWFYDHRGSKGSESPLFKSLVGSGGVGLAIWLAIRRQLRKYMTLEIAPLPQRIKPSDSIRAASLVRGRSRVQLDDALFRVVACNFEKGQYKRGSGTKVRTVSFKEPTRAVVLYERRLASIPADTAVEGYLDGEVKFEPMFRSLYPPQEIGTSHGVAVHWEVQLLHPQLVDQELVGSTECFTCSDFMEG